MYHRQAKGQHSLFDDLMRQTSWHEVLDQGIARAKGGISSGHDGCDADMWKLITEDPSNNCSPCLEVLTRYVNWILDLGHIPPTLKHGWITMVQ